LAATNSLARAIINRAKECDLPVATLTFHYGQHDGKITALEPFIGRSGWLSVAQYTVESLSQTEDHIILAAIAEDGTVLDEEAARRLFSLPGTASTSEPARTPPPDLQPLVQQRQDAITRTISGRNARFFETEVTKLENWADDVKLGLEREIKNLDRQIKEARRDTSLAPTLEGKLAGQKQIKALELQRTQKRRSLFEEQDKVDAERGSLIASAEARLAQKTSLEPVCTLHWMIS
jgi:adenine-specific DNA-methyltransferase